MRTYSKNIRLTTDLTLSSIAGHVAGLYGIASIHQDSKDTDMYMVWKSYMENFAFDIHLVVFDMTIDDDTISYMNAKNLSVISIDHAWYEIKPEDINRYKDACETILGMIK